MSAIAQMLIGYGSTADAAPMTAIAADGWQATVTSPSNLSLLPATVSRQGYDAAGEATTLTETIYLTQRVRLPYPNQATLTSNSQAVSDYVYSTDTIAGVANSSTEASPKPVANWIMPSRLTVGNTVDLEVVAFHRNARGGQQVACVVFRATDGTNTVTQTVSTPAVSNRPGDRNAVVSYKCALDITTLTAGLITCNAMVYPFIGASGSVLDSASSSVAREFSPRYFLKNTALAAAPPYAYVATSGNDGSGVVSTTAATAKASPFLTVLGAINGIHTALGATTGVDGAVIRIGNDGGTPFVLGSTAATRTQKCGALTIQRDPDVTRANARVSFGAAAFRPRLGGSLTSPLTTGALRFHDVGIVRTGTLAMTGEAATQLEVFFDDVDFDNGSNNSTWLGNAHDYHFGTTFTNAGSSSTLNAGTLEHRMLRGVSIDANTNSIEGWCVVGSAITRPNQLTRGSRTFSGMICAFNSFMKCQSNTASVIQIANDENIAGAAIVQNVFEAISTNNQPLIRISADSATGNTSHVIIHNNTLAGAFAIGRWNVFYDDGATRRTHKLMSVVGNIVVSLYTKSDMFRGQVEGGGDASSATGNWAFSNGVGCRANFTQFQCATPIGGNEAPDYEGIGSNFGTSTTTRNDPMFTSYAGTTVAAGPTYAAGAGGGDYTLQVSSPANAMLVIPVLSYDLAGAPRPPANDASGAYAP